MYVLAKDQFLCLLNYLKKNNKTRTDKAELICIHQRDKS